MNYLYTTPLVWDDRPVSFTGSSALERVEPITAPMVKKHVRFGSTSEDVLIDTYIAAARTYFEEQTGRQAVDAVWELAADRPPVNSVVEMPRPPLKNIVSITYDDANGDAQTMDAADYVVLPSFITPVSGAPAIDPYCARGRIELATGAAWPSTNGAQRSFRIRYTCGYGASADDIPALVQGMLYLLVGHFHRNRAEVSGGERWLVELPMGANVLMKAFKYSALPTRIARGLPNPLDWWSPCR